MAFIPNMNLPINWVNREVKLRRQHNVPNGTFTRGHVFVATRFSNDTERLTVRDPNLGIHMDIPAENLCLVKKKAA